MDTGFKHLHVLIVTLYLLQLFVKVVLMAMKKQEALEKFGAKTKIPHIVLAVLLLVTGIYLAIKSPAAHSMWMMVKILLVGASIPLGIVGIKKSIMPMVAISFIFLVYVFGLSMKKDFLLRSQKELVELPSESGTPVTTMERGAKLYDVYCARCHGADGDSGFQGAKDLAKSEMSDAEVKTIITQGKGVMPKVEGLSQDQLSALVEFSKSFR